MSLPRITYYADGALDDLFRDATLSVRIQLILGRTQVFEFNLEVFFPATSRKQKVIIVFMKCNETMFNVNEFYFSCDLI